MAVPPTSSEVTFSQSQLLQYFEHIKLPQKYHTNHPLDISFLTALHVHQIAAIPYENLSLHYTDKEPRNPSLDPQTLFHKFVTKGMNRGGYCMENTLFFLAVLRSLGFDVYPTGVRIRLRENGVPAGDFIGLVHIVLICTLSNGHKYVLDSAFGGDGPTKPLPLIEDAPTFNLGTQEVRYIHQPLAQNAPRPLTEPQKYWHYQYRNSPDKPWNSFYIFAETEFLLNDFEIMNFFTSEGKTFQRTTVLIIKFLRGEVEAEGQDARIVGKLMLVNGVVKRNMGGKTEVIKECKTEDERIEVLKEVFGIELTDAEREGITGLVTELKDKEILVA